MKNKFVNMFSPSKNWKTTLILVMLVSVITFFLTITMGFKFNHDGESETFKLLSKFQNSLGYIREIYYSGSPNNSFMYSRATFFSSIADYLLICLLFWFLVVIGFILNQFRFTRIITKTRRVINASIVLASTLILMIFVFNIWISYFQSVELLNNSTWSGSNRWEISWQTIFQLTIILFGVVLIVAISIYNLFVEINTVYISISKRNLISSNDDSAKPDSSESVLSE